MLLPFISVLFNLVDNQVSCQVRNVPKAAEIFVDTKFHDSLIKGMPKVETDLASLKTGCFTYYLEPTLSITVFRGTKTVPWTLEEKCEI